VQARVNSSNSYEGVYSIKLTDNSGVQSSMTSPVFDLSAAVGAHISFRFYPTSMESGDDFWAQYNDGSGSWSTIATFVSGTHFNNNAFYAASVTVPGFVPTSAGSFRIQCDAGEKNDQVYIDAVIITQLNGSELIEPGVFVDQLQKEGDLHLQVFPNPANDLLTISSEFDIQAIRIISLDGKQMRYNSTNNNTLDVSHLENGIYFLHVQVGDKWYPIKFCKM
jgi:hypothetical protein